MQVSQSVSKPPTELMLHYIVNPPLKVKGLNMTLCPGQQTDFPMVTYFSTRLIIYLCCACSVGQVIMEDAHLMNDDEEDLNKLSLPQFMMEYVYEHLSDPQKVLHEIGITPNSLKHSQLVCLIDIPLPSVYACFQRFVHWVDNGVYDFCNLPLTIKVHLSEENLTFIELELRDKWTGTTRELESEVKQMIEVLKHSEGDITKTVNKQATRVSPRHSSD